MGGPGAIGRGQRDAKEDARTAEEDASVAAKEDALTSWGRGAEGGEGKLQVTLRNRRSPAILALVLRQVCAGCGPPPGIFKFLGPWGLIIIYI